MLGVVLVTKKTKLGDKPAASLNRVTLKKGRRPVLSAVANSVKGYDKSKKRAAMKRASAVLRYGSAGKVLLFWPLAFLLVIHFHSHLLS